MSKYNDIVVFAHRLKFKNKLKIGGVDLFLKHIKGFYIFEFGFKDKYSFENKKVIFSKIKKSNKKILKIYNYKFDNIFLQALESLFFVLNELKNLKLIKPIFIYNNFLAGIFYIIVKLYLFKNSKSYFHMTDYLNRILINNTILKIVLSYSNLVGVMTNRSKKKIIQKYNLSKNKVFIVNNSIQLEHKKFKKNLVFVTGAGSVISKYRYEEIIKFCNKLKFHRINFKIFIFGSKNGDFKYFLKLKKLINKYQLNKNIIFPGFVTTNFYKKILKNQATFGIALYSKKENFDWMYYADPLKIREYLAYQIPFICDKTTEVGSLAIKKGIAIDFSKKKFFLNKFLNIVKNKKKKTRIEFKS